MKLITTQEYFDKNPTREERTAHINLNEPCGYMGMLREKFMSHFTKNGKIDRETRGPRFINAYVRGHDLPNLKDKVIINVWPFTPQKVETNHACQGECANPKHIYTGTKEENDQDRRYGFSRVTKIGFQHKYNEMIIEKAKNEHTD